MTNLNVRRMALGMILCAGLGMMAYFCPNRGSAALEGMTGPQDVMSLDRRISMLEQRFYTVESSIRQLERYSRSPSPITQPSASDQEIDLLRAQIQTLQVRLSEIECGLVRLDERTTSAATREARKNERARTTDPCRLSPAAPVRLSNRP